MYILTLKKGEERRADKHPWIFANTVQSIVGKDSQGSPAKVVTSTGRLVGYGFINHASKIIVRILTRDETPIDRQLFLERVLKAKNNAKLWAIRTITEPFSARATTCRGSSWTNIATTCRCRSSPSAWT